MTLIVPESPSLEHEIFQHEERKTFFIRSPFAQFFRETFFSSFIENGKFVANEIRTIPRKEPFSCMFSCKKQLCTENKFFNSYTRFWPSHKAAGGKFS